MRATLALAAVVAYGSGCAGPSVRADRSGTDSSASAASAVTTERAAAVPTTSAPAVPHAVEVPPPLETAGPGWQAGHRYTYRFALGSSVSFAGQTAADHELSGTLRLTCMTRSTDEIMLRVEVESPRVTSKSAAEQAELEQALPSLAAPFFATFKHGIVTGLRIAPGMGARAVGTYRSLVAALQLAQPIGAKQRWQARERDTTGEYLAEYRREPDGLVQKRKLRYLSLLVPSDDRGKLPASLLPEVTSSRAELRATREGQPLLVELQEQLALRQVEMPMLAVNRVSLRWLSDQGTSLEESERKLAETRPLGVDEALTTEADAAALDRVRIAGKSFEAITAELAALPRAGMLPSATSDRPSEQDEQPNSEHEQVEHQQRRRQLQGLIAALAATFRQEPRTTEQALDQIKAGAPIQSDLLDGLAASGSEASHVALIRLLESPDADAALRHAAVFALSRTPKPSEAAIRALATHVNDDYVGTQALYGLGTFCRILRQAGDAAASEALGRLLVQRLSAADGELAVTRALRAISNSGYAPALPVVRPFLDDTRDAVRADALEAIRLMEAPDVDPLLASRLTGDGDNSAQLAVLNALPVRKPTPALAQALSVAMRNTDPHVRYRAVEVAAAWLGRRPELRAALARVARHDSEEKIRLLASSGLARVQQK